MLDAEPGGTDERRFSEDEFLRILDEASASPETEPLPPMHGMGSTPPDGYTLEEIQEIAREALIDPASVERAARGLPDPRSIRVPKTPVKPFSRKIEGELRIGRPLSDSEMRLLAVETERVLARRGRFKRSGDRLEWHDEEDNTSISVLRDHRTTQVTVTFDQSADLLQSAGFLAGIGAVGIGVMVATLALPLLVIAVPTAVAGVSGLVWFTALGRTAITRDRLRKHLEHLEDLARTE